MSDLIRRCSVCKAVQVDGEYYFPGGIDVSDKCVSDTIFSESCAREMYGGDFDDFYGDIVFELKECPRG